MACRARDTRAEAACAKDNCLARLYRRCANTRNYCRRMHRQPRSNLTFFSYTGDTMKLKLIKLTAMLSLLAAGGMALAQDIKEHTIRFGHLNNTDHPTSMGVKK